MKIVTPQLDVNKGDAFTYDIFDRKDYGEILCNLVTKSDDALVITLDGKWGEGKTTFVKMWQGLLSASNVPNIYIDTFANDYVDDAFITVISAITKYAESNIVKTDQKTLNELKEKSKKVGSQLVSWSAKVSIRAATAGIIQDSDIDKLKNIQQDLSKPKSDIVSDLVGQRIAEHSEYIQLIKDFRILLSDLPSKLENSSNKPLVVILDELDRCRPTFAVEMLEKIKHLFSVNNVVFLLVINKTQLEGSIRSVYGKDIVASEYLQKFINIEAKLPKDNSERYSNDLNRYSNRLLELHKLGTFNSHNQIIDCIVPLANHLNLSLRQLEKVFTNLALFYLATSKEEYCYVVIVVFLGVLKVFDSLLFEALLQKKTSYEEIVEKLKLQNLNESHEHSYILNQIKKWIKYCLLSDIEIENLPDKDKDEIKSFEKVLIFSRREYLIPKYINRFCMFVSTKK